MSADCELCGATSPTGTVRACGPCTVPGDTLAKVRAALDAYNGLARYSLVPLLRAIIDAGHVEAPHADRDTSEEPRHYDPPVLEVDLIRDEPLALRPADGLEAPRHNIVCDECGTTVGTAWHVATTESGRYVWLHNIDPATHKCPPREDREP